MARETIHQDLNDMQNFFVSFLCYIFLISIELEKISIVESLNSLKYRFIQKKNKDIIKFNHRFGISKLSRWIHVSAVIKSKTTAEFLHISYKYVKFNEGAQPA